MTKTLYLHVGMPKCASTSIQDALEAHAGDLAARDGLFYGREPGDRSVGQGNVTQLEICARAGDEAQLRRHLAFHLQRDTDVVMSSELLIGLARAPMSDFIIREARAHGFAVRLICFVRRQDHWIESDYKQHLKGGSAWIGGIQALIAKRIRMRVLHYDWLLGNWTRSLDPAEMTVVPLNRGQGETWPLERFLAFAGLDPARAAGLSIGRRNVSPPVALIEPLRHLKADLVGRGLKLPVVSRHLERFVETARAGIDLPPRRFILSAAQRRGLIDRFAESNARLSARFLDGVPAFDESVEEDAPGLAPLSHEAAAVLGACVAAEIVRAAAIAAAAAQPPVSVTAPPPASPAVRDGLIDRLRNRLARL